MDDKRLAKGRARGLIQGAIKGGQLEFAPNGTIALGDFVAWAWAKSWLRDKFSDLPARLTPIELQTTITMALVGTAEISPPTLDECCKELVKAKALIHEQEIELAAQRGELERLRGPAAKYASIQAKNSNSARRIRKPR